LKLKYSIIFVTYFIFKMRKLNTIFQLIFGNSEDNILEDQVPLVLSFTTATLSLIAVALNFALRLSPLMIFIPLCAAVAMFFVFYNLRNGKKRFFYKVLMVAIAFMYFNFIWFYNYRSYGPNLYLFLLLFIFIIMIFDGKSRLLFSSFLLINILALFLVEYYTNEMVTRYKDEETRIIDHYASFIIYLAFTSIMALIIRYYYLLESRKAKSSDELKSTFLSNISHEIRTPMSAIMGFSKLLDYTNSEKEQGQYIKIINENGKILMQLFEDIIDISRMETGMFDIFRKGFNLNPVMEELRKLIRKDLDQQNKQDVKLTLVTSPCDISIYTDEHRLRQILINLLSNASKFTMKGEISFGYKLNGNEVEFFVSDTGIGIKEKYFKEIFTRFYKIENSEYTALPRGSGIGLSIVKLLVERLGGSIGFNSEYGKGSTFRFVLPDVLLDELLKTEAPLPEIYAFNKKNLVLVVDDDESNMMLITNMLKKIGVSYCQAGNGQEAIDMFNKYNQVNLVLLDINMPVMNGFEALRRLKALNPMLPVVALTAHAMASERENMINEGFDDYISKPVYHNLLVDCLLKYLSIKAKVAI